MKRLLVDIGNTATKFAVLENGELHHVLLVPTKEIDNKVIKSLPDVDEIFVSSVVPQVSELLKDLYKNKRLTFITSKFKSDVILEIDNPTELGSDLYCDLVGALSLNEKLPLLVVDLGTANKYLYIDENKVFSSCAITPGLELALLSLSSGTALLPNVKVGGAKKITDCHNTIDVLTASGYYSQIDSINGMVERYKNETKKDINILLTGGHYDLLKKDLSFPYKRVEDLCLIGIMDIVRRLDHEEN